MMRNPFLIRLGVSAACLMALTTSLAYADSTEVRIFLNAPHGMIAAINSAQTSAGGEAVAAAFDEDNGAGYYEIDIVNAGKQTEVTIDADSGAVVGSKQDGKSRDMDLARLGGSLAEIVATTEASTGGKVMSIDPEYRGGNFTGMEIEIANADGTLNAFMLNAADGALTSIPLD